VPAPIVYVSATQSSVIVPYEVATTASAQIVAVVNGVQSPPFTVPVVASLPTPFTDLKPVKKFTNRKVAVERIWTAIQALLANIAKPTTHVASSKDKRNLHAAKGD
jgi:uncharacterized protein (TIGR03437 family)